MKSINTLKDFGIGKRCVLIGNGPSAKASIENGFAADCTLIGMNRSPLNVDFIIYYDKDMQEYWEGHDNGSAKLIGFKNKKIDHTLAKCKYYYTLDDVAFGDTGFHALQIADKIMAFSEIYLTGYDYAVVGSTYHWYEDNSDAEKMDRFNKWSVQNVLPKYEKAEWQNMIFNLNKLSALRAFPFIEKIS